MNTHKALGLLAAVLITAAQALVFAADTSGKAGDNRAEAAAVVAQAHDGARADQLG